MPRHEATAAVTFSITYVTDGLLCEFEKIITELAAIIAKIIAQIKYPISSYRIFDFLLPDQINFQIIF
jgi:hypothetical protein